MRRALWIGGVCLAALLGWIALVQWRAVDTPEPRMKLAVPGIVPAPVRVTHSTPPATTSAAQLPTTRSGVPATAQAPTPSTLAPLDPAPTTLAANPDCPPPPITGYRQAPLQSSVPAGLGRFRMPNGDAKPLAGFSVEARVLSRKDYAGDQPARFSPLDLALGWGPMTDSITLTQLNVRQSNRWYHYGWMGDAPLDPGAIIRNSANMHMVPSSVEVERGLRQVQRDDWVRIDGWLVEIHDVNGWNWRSSMRRDDSGDGGCEVIYVCRVSRY